MQSRTALVGITLVLGAMLLSGCGGTQAIPNILPPTARPAQPPARLGATSIALPLPTSVNALPATAAVPVPPPDSTAQGQATTVLAATPEQAVAPEQNPAGDIPDTQAFVSYASATGGYSLDVPEGWARSTNAANVRFESKLDGVSVTMGTATTAPTAASARPRSRGAGCGRARDDRRER